MKRRSGKSCRKPRSAPQMMLPVAMATHLDERVQGEVVALLSLLLLQAAGDRSGSEGRDDHP